ncbi:hypothetical protein [Roseicitreum antarcticum]|uniref:hypothetical protein n=2 Tax=Roseicitreum antarcticum TaxID=564137 RepID=UPI001680B0A7|nr:hypothetical protein [Roseicitreum antarcticum]
MPAKFNKEIFAKLWCNHKVPTAKIAETIGFTRQACGWHAKRMGLPPRSTLRRTIVDPTLAKEMYLAGVSLSEIARYFGSDHSQTVGNAVRRMGLPKRERGPSGKHNGGWKPTMPIRQFIEERMGQKMAELAIRERSK